MIVLGGIEKEPWHEVVNKLIALLDFFNPFPLDPRKEKLELNFYFHTSFWCLKRFHEGL